MLIQSFAKSKRSDDRGRSWKPIDARRQINSVAVVADATSNSRVSPDPVTPKRVTINDTQASIHSFKSQPVEPSGDNSNACPIYYTNRRTEIRETRRTGRDRTADTHLPVHPSVEHVNLISAAINLSCSFVSTVNHSAAACAPAVAPFVSSHSRFKNDRNEITRLGNSFASEFSSQGTQNNFGVRGSFMS